MQKCFVLDRCLSFVIWTFSSSANVFCLFFPLNDLFQALRNTSTPARLKCCISLNSFKPAGNQGDDLTRIEVSGRPPIDFSHKWIRPLGYIRQMFNNVHSFQLCNLWQVILLSFSWLPGVSNLLSCFPNDTVYYLICWLVCNLVLLSCCLFPLDNTLFVPCFSCVWNFLLIHQTGKRIIQ